MKQQPKQMHTPGPWRLAEARDGMEYGAIYGPDGGLVATTGYRCIAGNTEDDANACLIAAAPEMLDALMLAKKFIEIGVEFGMILMPDADCPDPAHDTLPAICAAIAKAKGEAHV